MNRTIKWLTVAAIVFCLLMVGATVGRLVHSCPKHDCEHYLIPSGMD